MSRRTLVKKKYGAIIFWGRPNVKVNNEVVNMSWHTLDWKNMNQ